MTYLTPPTEIEILIYRLNADPGTPKSLDVKKIARTDWYYWAGQGWKSTEAEATGEPEQARVALEIAKKCDRVQAAFVEYQEALQDLDQSVQQFRFSSEAEAHWAGTLQGFATAATSFSPLNMIEAIRQIFG